MEFETFAKAVLGGQEAVEAEDINKALVCIRENSDQSLVALRFLRNCASVPKIQNILVNDFSEELISTLKKRQQDKSDDPVIKRLIWQTLYNCSVNQPSFLSRISTEFSQDSHQVIVNGSDEKAKNIVCAILFLQLKNDQRQPGPYQLDFLQELVRAAASGECDFALLTVKELILDQAFLDRVPGLDLRDRLSVEDVIQLVVEEHKDDRNEAIERTLAFVAQAFKKQSGLILTALKNSNAGDLHPEEMLKLLEILGQGTSRDDLRPLLQKDMSLLIDSIYLLRMLHESGKNSPDDPALAPANKSLNDFTDPSHAESPVYGFKRDLIRLIGNLSYRHKINQDQIRDCNCIELLLDCSPLDGKNPMISQWVVLAIRNICEGNKENQDVIASVDKKGAMNSAVLSEMGIDVHR